MLDAASPELRALRQRCRHLERDVDARLQQVLRQPDSGACLQERFVTVRNNRFVVPVRREAKAGLPGVVHDHSNSGRTLFVEPTVTLALGNELADLRLEERDEVRRILAALSAQVRAERDALLLNQDTLAEFDAATAVAAWAHDYEAVLPQFGAPMRLRQARHPLLARQLRRQPAPGTPVPLDLELAPDTGCLLITGSNSGGKTVALKTVGLLTLAAQAGLPVPVREGSRFEVFAQVFADIGDEQSLTANLSTFSGHVGRIAATLRAARKTRSLVLLDELGAGTDPLAGGALAAAILVELSRCRALTLATTHLGVVKTFVHEREDMMNAAVRFNSENLEPEYALDIGRPGASHALAIARRFGIPARVLRTAETMMTGDHFQLEGLLARLEEEHRQVAAHEQEVRGQAAAASRDRETYRSELSRLRAERRRLLHDAYRQAAGIIDNTRKQMERLVAEVRDPGSRRTAAAAARKQLNRRRDTLRHGLAETEPQPQVPVRPESLRLHGRVHVASIDADGRLVALNRDRTKAVVEVGQARFSVPVADLGQAPPAPAPAPVVKVSQPRPQGHVTHELNLVGSRVGAALPELDGFLDRALLARLGEVRVIHGFGSGKLQEAVHEALGQNPCVRSFRLGRQDEDPGGAGVTVVSLISAAPAADGAS